MIGLRVCCACATHPNPNDASIATTVAALVMDFTIPPLSSAADCTDNTDSDQSGKSDNLCVIIQFDFGGGYTGRSTRLPNTAFRPSIAQFSPPPPPAPPPTPMAPIISPSTTMGRPPEFVKN